MVMLDLCCGLGGASRPMVERGWRVVRVDNRDDCAADVVADMRALPLAIKAKLESVASRRSAGRRASRRARGMPHRMFRSPISVPQLEHYAQDKP